MNEYNGRQLKIMLDKIQRYENGKINFGELIQDLDALLDSMTDLDDKWRNEFHSHWFTLETYYALALNRESSPFELDEDGHIPEAIEIIKSMIYSELQKCNESYEEPEDSPG